MGLVKGTKGYIFMRSPNNIIFTTIQALFDKTLFPKCPNMCCPGYTPVGLPPDDLQGIMDLQIVRMVIMGVDFHLFQWDQQLVRCHGSICNHLCSHLGLRLSPHYIIIHLCHQIYPLPPDILAVV
jgi:hypothetical protein